MGKYDDHSKKAPRIEPEITELGPVEAGDDVVTDIVTETKTEKIQTLEATSEQGIVSDSKESRDKNITTKKLYNTISCPCSSYAVLDSNGSISCETLDLGIKRSIKSIVIKNHYIDGKMPRTGDKWRCLKNCKQDDFKWNAYHIVKVEENKTEISSSLVNSILSTSNCYIPPTTLKDYKGETIDEKILALKNAEIDPIDGPVNGRDLSNPIAYVNGKPLYESKDHIYWYTRLFGSEVQRDSFTYFENEDYKGYIPFNDGSGANYVSSIMVNGRDILPLHNGVMQSDKDCVSKTLFDSSYESGKMTISPSGGKIKILIHGQGDPMFTLSLDNSSNCTILKKRLRNVKLNNTFELTQEIPFLPDGLSEEVYTLKITPGIDFQIFTNGHFTSVVGDIKMKIYQFARNTITLSAATSTISNVTQTSSNSTFLGEMKEKRNVDTTHTINVKRSSGTDNYYIKDKVPPIEDVISYDTVIKKKVIKDESDGRVIDAVNEITVVNAFTSDGTTVTNKGDVKKGMSFDFTVEKTKTVRKSIDLDIHKEPCDDCDDELDILTNRFELENTSDLFKEMYVEGVDYKGLSFITDIKSIDCNKTITLEDEIVLNKNTELTFKHSEIGLVGCVTQSGKGEKLELSRPVIIPRNTTINFNNPIKPKLEGYIKYDRSGDNGVNGITISTVITEVDFGQENTTITIDTDSLITNKPNACDQYLTAVRGRDLYVDFSRCDVDTNKLGKTVTITKQPNSGVVNNVAARESKNVTWAKKYTPNLNFKGKDTIKYTTSDGVNSSDEKTIYITVK